MPFDCMPAFDNRKLDKVAPLPTWQPNRGPESVDRTMAVLIRARRLIMEERRWCQGAFARWGAIAVPMYSIFARRFCAIGAVMRAGRELMLGSESACMALQSRTGRPVEDRNDDPKRAHAEVVALFDAAIVSLRQGAI